KQPKLPHLDLASTEELVAMLEHPNGWHRDTAARLLYQRQDKSAVSALLKLQNSPSAVGRLHALYALDGLGALREEQVLRALADADAHLREHGIRLSEHFFAEGAPSPGLWTALTSLTNDASLNVRYQLALTLGDIKHPGRLDVLEQLVRSNLESHWVQSAVLSGLAEGADGMFVRVAKLAHFQQAGAGLEFLRELVRIV